MRKVGLLFILGLLFVNLIGAKGSPEIDKSTIEVVDTVKWTSIEALRDQSGLYRIHYIGHDHSEKYIDSSISYIEFIEDQDRAGEIDMLTYVENNRQFFYGYHMFVEETPESRIKVLCSRYQ